ncbi:hypothetical protein P7C73_g6540, partial [Tremellales sp. Uapishka_1]
AAGEEEGEDEVAVDEIDPESESDDTAAMVVPEAEEAMSEVEAEEEASGVTAVELSVIAAEVAVEAAELLSAAADVEAVLFWARTDTLDSDRARHTAERTSMVVCNEKKVLDGKKRSGKEPPFLLDSCSIATSMTEPETSSGQAASGGAAVSSRSPVAYIWSQPLQEVADQLPANPDRSSVVHGLHRALGLLHDPTSDDELERAVIVAPDAQLASPAELRRYHDARYVDFLMSGDQDGSESASSSSSSTGSTARKRRKRTHHGLEHDCAPFPSLPAYATLVASATLTACRLLSSPASPIRTVINWDGGRHHAMRNRASGFCYVADIVLGIMSLAKIPVSVQGSPPRRPRILYLDMDLHFGDGVAQAFRSPSHFPSDLPASAKTPRPPQVLTLSIHHSSPIFFPPSSTLSALPDPATPHPFTLSLPLAAYPSIATYRRVMEECIEPVCQAFDADYIVLQLGLDGLPRDPIGQYGNWNIDDEGGLKWCLRRIQTWNKKMLVLGGGGYDNANAARGWAAATAVLLGRDLSPETNIPPYEHFPAFAPSFTMEIPPSNIPDENTSAYLSQAAEVFAALSTRIAKIVNA